MRATIASLALATAAVALQACGYPPAPVAAAAKAPGAVRAASEADRDRAEQLIRAKFAGEGGNVSQVELYPAC